MAGRSPSEATPLLTDTDTDAGTDLARPAASPATPADGRSGAGRRARGRERGARQDDTASARPPDAEPAAAPTPLSDVQVLLNQFRGFVILYNCILPSLGYLAAAPACFRATDTFLSLQDAGFPMLLAALGFAMQRGLPLLKRRLGGWGLLRWQLRRCAVLLAVGIVFQGLDGFATWSGPGGMQEAWWRIFTASHIVQDLTVVPFAVLICFPAVGSPPAWRAAYALALLGVYLGLQYAFWFHLLGNYVDGGVVGTIAWAATMLGGTLLHDVALRTVVPPRAAATAPRPSPQHSVNAVAIESDPSALLPPEPCEDASADLSGSPAPLGDALAKPGTRRPALHIALLPVLVVVVASCTVMAAGVALSAAPQTAGPVCFSGTTLAQVPCSHASVPSWPFVPPNVDTIALLTVSKRSASVPFQLCGFSVALAWFGAFIVLVRVLGRTWSFLQILSENGLLIYVLRGLSLGLAADLVPVDGPLWLLPVVVLLSTTTIVAIALFLHGQRINFQL